MTRTSRNELDSFVTQNTSKDNNRILLVVEGNAVITITLNQDNKPDGSPLCSISTSSFDGTSEANIEPVKSKIQTDIENICEMSGLYTLELEFTPSNSFQLESNDREYFKDKITILKKMSTTTNPEFWLLNILKSLQIHHAYFVPDTNFIVRRYYSNYVKNIINFIKSDNEFISQNIHNTIQMCLSRLTILELEGGINKVKSQIDALESKLNNPVLSMIQKLEPVIEEIGPRKINGSTVRKLYNNLKKDIGENEDYNLLKKKCSHEKNLRINFQALSETLTIILERAELMPQIDYEMITAFSKSQGTGFADTWIRNEISSFKLYLNTVDEIQPVPNYRTVFFLTSDLVNALASIAENNNTIYIYRNKEQILDKKISHEKIPLILFNSVIIFGSCDIVFGKKRYLFESMWDGKTPDDWKNEILMCTEIKEKPHDPRVC